jgi:hypothetical protein
VVAGVESGDAPVLGLTLFECEPERTGFLPPDCLLGLFRMDYSASDFATSDAMRPVLTVDSVVKSVTRVLLQAPNPFAIQNGNQLLLLDVDAAAWHVAELQFQAEDCTYTEVRRASYDMPREAIGALLSRALAEGETAMIDTVECLHGYLMRHYNIPVVNF